MILNRLYGTSGGGESATIKVLANEGQTVTATKGDKVRHGVWRPKTNPEWRGLPEGYTQVKNITFGSGKYISFEAVDFTQDFEVEIAATPSNTTTTWIPVLINRYTGGFWFGFNNGSCVVRLFNGSNYISVTPPPINVTTTFTIKKVGVTTSLYFDGVLKGSANNIPYVNTTGSEPTSLGTDGTTNAFNGTIAKAKFGGYDLVPCFNSNNEYGMYDMVTGTFFGNSGTGAFTGGEIVPQYDGYAYYIESIDEYGTWTVSNGTRTKDVEIEEATEYEVDLIRTYLYRHGDECVDVTGGWNNTGYTIGSGGVTKDCIKNTDHITSPAFAWTNTAIIGIANSIDLSNFAKMFVIFTTAAAGQEAIYIHASKTNFGSGYKLLSHLPVGTKATYEIDISNITNGFIVFANGGNVVCDIYAVWLE